MTASDGLAVRATRDRGAERRGDGPAALGAYAFAPRDARENFPQSLLYVGWDLHRLYCAPLCIAIALDTPFEAFRQTRLPALFGRHPDFARIDWRAAQWFRGDVIFTPKPEACLRELGFGHKSLLRFRTPGLEGLKGSGA